MKTNPVGTSRHVEIPYTQSSSIMITPVHQLKVEVSYVWGFCRAEIKLQFGSAVARQQNNPIFRRRARVEPNSGFIDASKQFSSWLPMGKQYAKIH